MTSTGHLFSVAQQSNNKFQFFVDGTPQLPSPLIEMTGTAAPNANLIRVGGEVVWDTTVPGPEPVSWTATVGGAGNTVWQRFNNTLGWQTVQSWTGVCNGGQNVCSGGGWVFNTSSFPSSWKVSH